MDIETVRRAMLERCPDDLSNWPDPHPNLEAPAPEEYSRVTDRGGTASCRRG